MTRGSVMVVVTVVVLCLWGFVLPVEGQTPVDLSQLYRLQAQQCGLVLPGSNRALQESSFNNHNNNNNNNKSNNNQQKKQQQPRATKRTARRIKQSKPSRKVVNQSALRREEDFLENNNNNGDGSVLATTTTRVKDVTDVADVRAEKFKVEVRFRADPDSESLTQVFGVNRVDEFAALRKQEREAEKAAARSNKKQDGPKSPPMAAAMRQKSSNNKSRPSSSSNTKMDSNDANFAAGPMDSNKSPKRNPMDSNAKKNQMDNDSANLKSPQSMDANKAAMKNSMESSKAPKQSPMDSSNNSANLQSPTTNQMMKTVMDSSKAPKQGPMDSGSNNNNNDANFLDNLLNRPRDNNNNNNMREKKSRGERGSKENTMDSSSSSKKQSTSTKKQSKAKKSSNDEDGNFFFGGGNNNNQAPKSSNGKGGNGKGGSGTSKDGNFKDAGYYFPDLEDEDSNGDLSVEPDNQDGDVVQEDFVDNDPEDSSSNNVIIDVDPDAMDSFNNDVIEFDEDAALPVGSDNNGTLIPDDEDEEVVVEEDSVQADDNNADFRPSVSQRFVRLTRAAVELSAQSFEDTPQLPEEPPGMFDLKVYRDEPDAAVFARYEEYCIVAFRGLVRGIFADVIQAFNPQLSEVPLATNPDCTCWFRRGWSSGFFTEYHSQLIADLTACASECSNPADCVVLAGASAGGAIATVATVHLAHLLPLTFTFGAPATVRLPCDIINPAATFRFVNTEVGRFGQQQYDYVAFSPHVLETEPVGQTIILGDDTTRVANLGIVSDRLFPQCVDCHRLRTNLEVAGVLGYQTRIRLLYETSENTTSPGIFPGGFAIGNPCGIGAECESAVCVLGQCRKFALQRCEACLIDADCAGDLTCAMDAFGCGPDLEVQSEPHCI